MNPYPSEDRLSDAAQPSCGDGGLAALRPRLAIPSENEAQQAFRRLCTSRATRRAIRDHRLSGKR